MNKILNLLIVFIFGSAIISAQNIEKHNISGTLAPPQQWDEWFNKQVEIFTKNLQTNGKSQIVNYTIPIIVHVVHFGEAVGTFPNVDSNQIYSQLTVLNNDFAGTGLNIGNVPAVFSNLVANTGIKFCFATKNPNGAALTERGIDRINAQTNAWQNPTTATLNIQNYIENTVKLNSIWDPVRYLNIWISDRPPSSTISSYATYPAGTNLSGLIGGSIGTAVNDGIWIWTKNFGTVGTILAPRDKGRTATQEIGHWLGLRNIWGDGNCLSDYCNDTPWSKQENTGCLTHPVYIDRCGVSQSPNGEMFMNFMDGTDDICKNMFTIGQSIRMQTAMSQCTNRNLLGTHSLCTPFVLPTSSAFASFDVNAIPCLGQAFTPNNTSTGGPQPSFIWSSIPPASFFPSPSVPNPAITFNSAGNYTLTLVATNSLNASTYTLVVNSVTNCSTPTPCIDSLRIIRKTDTLTTYKAPNNSLVLGCQTGFAGFLTGTNCYKDKEFAQFYSSNSFSATPFPQVNSVIVLFDSIGTKPSSPNSGTQILCRIYGGAVSTGPGAQLGQQSESLVNIAASTKTNTIKYCGSPTYTFTTSKIIPYKFNFQAPILINNISGFFAAVQTPYFSSSDSIKIFSNTKTYSANDSSSWFLQYNNTWRTFRTFRSAKVQLAIIPQITCSPIVGIKENITNFNSNISIMPNPTSGQFNLIFTLPKEEELFIKIYNSIGQQISSEHLQNVSNNLINLDLSNKPSGIYFTEISNGTERVIKKIIVNH